MVHKNIMWLKLCERFMKFLQVVSEELRIQDVYPVFDIRISYIAKSMLCHGKPQKSIWSKYKIDGAQVHDETKILWKFHKIPSSGLGGVANT